MRLRCMLARLRPMANPPRFIHLRVHTEHSLLEGAVPVKKLVEPLRARRRCPPSP